MKGYQIPGMRTLKVYSNDRLVGWLAEINDIWRFEYAPEWVKWEHAWDISPPIPRGTGQIVDGSTLRPVQWFFDNLLPEDRMRTAIAAKANIAEADAFALLAYLGAESAGSLVLLPPSAEMPEEQGASPLSDEELDRRIQNMPKVPIAATSPKRMSLAGAQQKLLVNWDCAQLSEPLGMTPSTHILKPDHLSGDYPHSVINEYAMMKLAARLGLDVPAVWRHYCPRPVYIVERFDRHIRRTQNPVDGPNGVQEPVTDRLHVIDTCQLLNKAHIFKYSQASLVTLQQVIASTRNRLATRLGLFRWLVFNILIGNHDNHLKNISLLVSAEGVSLAKTYDLLSTAVYHTEAFPMEGAKWPEIDLAIPLPNQYRFANVTRAGVVAGGAVLGLPAQICEREIDSITSRISPDLDTIIASVELDNAQMPANTRQYLGGELRLLRAIRHIIVAQMLQKISHGPSSGSVTA
jgi:serine/threonine-protein kinase HipA